MPNGSALSCNLAAGSGHVLVCIRIRRALSSW
jgi:hypothetical protein